MITITRDTAVSLLTQDGYYREMKRWPLLTSKTFLVKTKTPSIKDIFYCSHYSKSTLASSLSLIKSNLEYSFPFVNNILEKFKDHLIVCGGALTSLCNEDIELELEYSPIKSDIDFFFYDLSVNEAKSMRLKIIDYIVELWKPLIGNKQLKFRYLEPETLLDVDFVIERNEYVTTINIIEHYSGVDWKDNHITHKYVYQFIHRIYPDISSIIGGFDLSACMLAYDGNELYATPLGAWSIKNKCIIVDMTRRSTSYEYRLSKYLRRGFTILFPGLLQYTIQKHLTSKILESDEYKKTKFIHMTNSYANELGLNIMDPRTIIYSYHPNNNKRHRMMNEGEHDYDFPKYYEIQKDNNILPYLGIAPQDLEEFEKHRCYNFEYCISGNITGKYKRDIVDMNLIDKVSDYSHYNGNTNKDNFAKINFAKLRVNKLTAVTSIYKVNINDKLENIDKLDLGINDDIISNFRAKALEYINNIGEDPIKMYHQEYALCVKYFGEYTNIVLKNMEDANHYLDIIIDRIYKNMEICEQNLKEIKWITKNPGTQWTSSINPVFEDPRKWYGKHYTPVLTGIPEDIETCMRLARLRSIWFVLPDDIFKYILQLICKSYADDAWKYI